jgi:hypothetical protein
MEPILTRYIEMWIWDGRGNDAMGYEGMDRYRTLKQTGHFLLYTHD